MRIGVCSISASDQEIQEVMETVSTIGYDAIEIWGKSPHVLRKSSDEAHRLSQLASALDLDISVYGSYLRAGTPYFEEEMQIELEFATQLGADMIRIWAGNENYNNCSENYWNQVVSDIRTFTRLAAKRGLSVTVERHFGSVTDTTEGARNLIKAIDQDACGLNWQIPLKQTQIDGETQSYVPEDEWGILSDAQELAPLSNNIHIQSRSNWGPAAGWKTRCLMREAFFDWKELFSIFIETGFQGIAEIEMTPAGTNYKEILRKEYSFFQDAIQI